MFLTGMSWWWVKMLINTYDLLLRLMYANDEKELAYSLAKALMCAEAERDSEPKS